MDLLIVEPLEAEVMEWLSARYAVRFAPELANDPLAFRQAMYNVRALIAPPTVTIDAQLLHGAPVLRLVGRVSAGAENIDLEACGRARVDVVRAHIATAAAEAEFMIGALLGMLRRVLVAGSDGAMVGRELGACTVGLVGMAPAARTMSNMLTGFGSNVVGYDPSLHANDALFERWRIRPLGLRELIEQSDAVCVQLPYYSRYHGLLGERFLPFCKPNQVIVSIAHSGLFDEAVLIRELASGRIAAAWLDSLEPGKFEEGGLNGGLPNFQSTPRLASTTRESKLRSAWSVAKRMDELLNTPATPQPGFRSTEPGEPADMAAEPPVQ